LSRSDRTIGLAEAAMSVFDILVAFHAQVFYIHQIFRYARSMPAFGQGAGQKDGSG
jgi:hypothetical protein